MLNKHGFQGVLLAIDIRDPIQNVQNFAIKLVPEKKLEPSLG